MRKTEKTKITKKSIKLKKGFGPLYAVMLCILILYAASLFMILGWGFMTSFKSNAEFRINILGLPKKWVWNYKTVYDMFFISVQTSTGQRNVYVPKMMLNSLLYCGCAVFKTGATVIVAYACGHFHKFKFSKIVYLYVLITMLLPIVGAQPAELKLLKELRIYDNFIGMWIWAAGFSGLYFLIFYNIFKSAPAGYTEAAKIDGASNLTIMVRITLPLVKGAIMTVFLLHLISYWNTYQTILLYLPTHPNIAVGVLRMSQTTENGMNYIPMRVSAAFIMILPTVAIFMMFSKQLMGNITIGGLKG